MPEKTFKYKAMKYKAKYLAAIANKGQTGGENTNIDKYNNMISMTGGNVDTPASLSYISDSD